MMKYVELFLKLAQKSYNRNIEIHSQFFGGIWETALRSGKYPFKTSIENNLLIYEGF